MFNLSDLLLIDPPLFHLLLLVCGEMALREGVEAVCVAWVPYQWKNTDTLEKVQMQAAR